MDKVGWVQAKAARLLGLTPRQIGYACATQHRDQTAVAPDLSPIFGSSREGACTAAVLPSPARGREGPARNSAGRVRANRCPNAVVTSPQPAQDKSPAGRSGSCWRRFWRRDASGMPTRRRWSSATKC
ncbi:MAG: helix-turn-helix domain-containing protein [Rhodospirillales bacterium]